MRFSVPSSQFSILIRGALGNGPKNLRTWGIEMFESRTC